MIDRRITLGFLPCCSALRRARRTDCLPHFRADR